MSDIMLTAPATFAPGATTYAPRSKRAYIVTPERTVTGVDSCDVLDLEAHGYGHPVVEQPYQPADQAAPPTPQPEPQPGPVA